MGCSNQRVEEDNTQRLPNTEPGVYKDISAGLNAWQLQLPSPPITTTPGQLQLFVLWDNFAYGFLVNTWRTTQENYYFN